MWLGKWGAWFVVYGGMGEVWGWMRNMGRKEGDLGVDGANRVEWAGFGGGRQSRRALPKQTGQRSGELTANYD